MGGGLRHCGDGNERGVFHAVNDFFIWWAKGCEGSCRCGLGKVVVHEIVGAETDSVLGFGAGGMRDGFGFVKPLQDERVRVSGAQRGGKGVGPFALGHIVADGDASGASSVFREATAFEHEVALFLREIA